MDPEIEWGGDKAITPRLQYPIYFIYGLKGIAGMFQNLSAEYVIEGILWNEVIILHTEIGNVRWFEIGIDIQGFYMTVGKIFWRDKMYLWGDIQYDTLRLESMGNMI